jgi:hypothetical protein
MVFLEYLNFYTERGQTFWGIQVWGLNDALSYINFAQNSVRGSVLTLFGSAFFGFLFKN